MWDFSIGGTLAAMARTAPFIGLRLLVYFGVALLYLCATGSGAAAGFGFGLLGGDEEARGAGALIGAIVGFAGASGILWLAREYILYMLKAGHIAVLARLYDGLDIPSGRGQLDYAAGVVRDHFAQANVLLAVDQAIKAVLRVLTGIVAGFAWLLPIPGLGAVARIVNAVVRMSVTYVDEIILAHNLRTGSANPWETSRQALVLYAQNYGRFLKNAMWLWALGWLITLAILAVVVAPAAALAALAPDQPAGYAAVGVTFVLGWALRSALLEPFSLYALMQVYFKTIEGQVADPEWDARLAAASKRFRQMTEKARAWPPEPAPAAAEAAG